MPRRRRPTRPVRRPNFRPAPEASTGIPEDGLDEEGGAYEVEEEPPVFADEPVSPATDALYGGSGPVETRPHWVARNERTQGRRLAQLRRSSGEERGTGRIAAGALPTFERAYIVEELRRILVTTGALTALLVVLALVLR